MWVASVFHQRVELGRVFRKQLGLVLGIVPVFHEQVGIRIRLASVFHQPGTAPELPPVFHGRWGW